MDFLSFCRAHGILIPHLPPLGLWRRYPTEDKPRHRNGAVKFMGDHGFVQNHATEVSVSVWKPDEPVKIDRRDLMEKVRASEQETLRRQAEAARKAAWILHQCQFAHHEYLRKKGHPEEVGNIFVKNGEKLLVIPMRIGKNLVGVQLIDEAGGKKFLTGMRSAGAEFVLDNKGPHFLCEGYATALSLRSILKELQTPLHHPCVLLSREHAEDRGYAAQRLRHSGQRPVRDRGAGSQGDWLALLDEPRGW